MIHSPPITRSRSVLTTSAGDTTVNELLIVSESSMNADARNMADESGSSVDVTSVSSSGAAVITSNAVEMTASCGLSGSCGNMTFSYPNPIVSVSSSHPSIPYGQPYLPYPLYPQFTQHQFVPHASCQQNPQYPLPYQQFPVQYPTGTNVHQVRNVDFDLSQNRFDSNNFPQYRPDQRTDPNPSNQHFNTLSVGTDTDLINLEPPSQNISNFIPRSFHRDFKLPNFWKDQPKAWFEFVEGKLKLMNIETDSLKYYAIADVLSSDTNIRRDIRDILDKPPVENKYAALRERLEGVYSETSRQKIETLLSTFELGDRRPSQLLRELQFHAGNMCDTNFLKQIWNRRLPQCIRTVLASLPEDYPLEKLSKIADDVLDAQGQNFINSIAKKTVPNEVDTKHVLASSVNSIESTLLSAITQLSTQLAQLNSNFLTNNSSNDKQNSRQRSRSRSSQHEQYRTNSKSRDNSQSRQHDVCWYHRKYNENAKHCRSPCKFSVNVSENK